MTLAPVADPRELALLKAVGLDRVAPEQRELAIKIAERYELDLLLKHIVLIDGKPYVTRDALLYIAHRSGQFDGIEVTTPEVIGDEWRCTATVWRKDFSHPFVYGGRYPLKGGNAKYAPEMAIKVAESMALRRAFNVAAPVVEERWDLDSSVRIEEVVQPTLAARAAEKAATLHAAEIHAAQEGYAPVAEPIEAPSVPAFPETAKGGPLTPREFKELLGKSSVSVDAAAKLFHETYPDKPTMASLTDEERGFLWLVISA